MSPIRKLYQLLTAILDIAHQGVRRQVRMVKRFLNVPLALPSGLGVRTRPTIVLVHRAFAEDSSWKSITSWYVVETQDQWIGPALERYYARQTGTNHRDRGKPYGVHDTYTPRRWPR